MTFLEFHFVLVKCEKNSEECVRRGGGDKENEGEHIAVHICMLRCKPYQPADKQINMLLEIN